MLRYLAAILLFLSNFALANAPRVPATLDFAGIRLTISEAARKQIQTDVDALCRNQTYFYKKVEKVDQFFPIIERVFREENIPEDFKYLIIQESALIADAVSTSNAVGFWQFKEMTAREVGLTVDRNIDERMNITASSHAAAKYLKKNNFFFDNWVYALLAYNTGPGGAEQHVEKKYFGAKKMDITRHTHWYVKKFLAHKIAFENEVGKNQGTGVRLYEYSDVQDKTLKDLADHLKMDYETIAEYNKWIKKGRIPSDKVYTAIIPVSPGDDVAINLLSPARKSEAKNDSRSKIAFENTYKPISEFDFNNSNKYPLVKKSLITQKIRINGLPGFIASGKDKISTITIDHGVTQKDFMEYNDMTSADEIIEGQVYYLKAKKSKAKVHYHVVIPGENAWSISQKYGIKLKKLLTKNRLREEKNLGSGMVVWLRFIRPAAVPVEYRKTDAQNVIVKSTPNEISFPAKTSPQTETHSETYIEEPGEHNSDALVDDDSDFLFEEADGKSEFIDENSSVSLDNVREEPPLSRSGAPEISKDNSQQTGQKKKIYHIVKTGETLFSISRIYDVSIGEIRQWNDISDLDVLSIGQRIVIHTAENIEDQNQALAETKNYKTYTVKRNDTLYSIARQNGLSIKELMELNQKEDFNISEGEILKIKIAD
jgi:membrane-bound lytic murein transglycosylase D